MCWALAEKLAICATTITALAERCHGQSQLLATRAEKRSPIQLEPYSPDEE